MLIRLTKRVFFGRKNRKTDQTGQKSEHDGAADTNTKTAKTKRKTPDWETALTSSFRENCLAPADEEVLSAFDLYCDELDAPLNALRREMADLHDEISAEVLMLQSLTPEMVERALARHRIEDAHFIDNEEDF